MYGNTNNGNSNYRGNGGYQRNERTQAYNQNLEQQLASQEKKTAFRRTVDHGNNMGRWHILRSMGLTDHQQAIGTCRPESSYLIDLLPSLAYSSSKNLNCNNNRSNMAIMDTQTKFVHLSSNKDKHSIQTVKWTPEGRRLVVAAYSGEFTIWNGMTFNFETIMQAHDSPILTLQYSHNDEWLISGDQQGVIKYWQPNFNNVNKINGHTSGIRDIAFSPNDSKFLSCGDDSSLKIWNFQTGKEERSLTGHHWDVKTADWHPNLGLIVSGSKDNLVKLWDPRQSEAITTLLGFKHTVTRCRFQLAGTNRLLASASRDRSCRIFDLRTMKDILVLRDHETDLSCVAWHPIHASMLTTAAYNGSMNHYVLDSYIPVDSKDSKLNTSNPGSLEAIHKIPYAHEKGIHALEYHPLGHLLCSAGSDKTARFWCRARPNDPASYNDPLYTDKKQGAWYYSINNNINAVMDPNENGTKSSAPEDGQQKSSIQLPGFNYDNQSNGIDSTQSIPGLQGIPGLQSY